MRKTLVCLIFVAVPAWGQAPSTGQPPSTSKAPAVKAPANGKTPANGKALTTGAATDRLPAPCPDCGVVRTIKLVRKELQPTPSTESRPSGLVASVPLGGGKASVGSSSKYGKDMVTTSESWEITVLLDDGRYRLIRVGEEPEVREGDKVRVEPNGSLVLRTD